MWLFFIFLLFPIPGSPFSCPEPVKGPREAVGGLGSCLSISCRYDLCGGGPETKLRRLVWIHRPVFEEGSREFKGRVVAQLPTDPPGAAGWGGDCGLLLPHLGEGDGGEYGLRLVAQLSHRPHKELLWIHRVKVNVTETPPPPHLWPDPSPITQGLQTSFGCWVPPSCPGDAPTFVWEGPAARTAGAFAQPWTPPATATPHPATGSLLTFSPFWYHDGTLLNCTLRAPDGRTIARASRLLQVNHPPRNVEVQMSPSHPVQEGEEVTLSCRDSARPPSHTFSWSLEGRTLPHSGARLFLSPVRAGDGGSYSCRATNDVGSTDSPPALLEVFYAPRDVRVGVSPPPPLLEGGEVTLSCGASSHPPPHAFSWSLGGRTLPHGGGPTLPLRPLGPAHAGPYQCRATNRLGTATSPTTTLEVFYPPRSAILENLTSLPALIGSRVSLRCSLGPAHPQPLVQWQRDGREVGPPGPALSFDADPAHAGLYRCIGQNLAGSALSPPLPVVVWYPPRSVRVLQTPGGPVVSGGGPVSLRCQVEGGEPPEFEVTWYKEGGQVPAPPAPQVLLLPDPQPHDAGTYVCQARNRAGGTRSDPHPLDVHFAPQGVELVATPGGGVEERSDVTLRCRARSRPPPTAFHWFREGGALGSSPRGLWVLRGVGVAAGGRYRCSVTNDVATRHSDDVTITVYYSTSTILRRTFLGLGVGLGLLLLLGSFGCFLRRRWRRQRAADEEPVVEPPGTFFLRRKKPHTPGSPRPPGDADDVAYSSVVTPPGAGPVPRLRGDTVVYTVLKRNEGAPKATEGPDYENVPSGSGDREGTLLYAALALPPPGGHSAGDSGGDAVEYVTLKH